MKKELKGDKIIIAERPQSANNDCGLLKFGAVMEILYKDKNLVAVVKPAGIPSQPDLSADKDAMTLTKEALFAYGEKNCELYLVHRLDRVVGGILVFARNKKSAAALSSLISERGAVKEYLAVVEGMADGGELIDFLSKDARAGKAIVSDKKRAGAKEARLEYVKISAKETEKGIRTLVRVRLHTGRFHQIRAQLSSHGNAIVGDGKYTSTDKGSLYPALFAFRLSFELDGKSYKFEKNPETENYPWSIFDYD